MEENQFLLCPDTLRLIAQHLRGMEDFAAFRLSCSLFSKVASIDHDFNGLYLRRNVPYLLRQSPTTNKKEENVSGQYEFYSLAKEKIVQKIILPTTTKGKSKLIESRGWLMIGSQKNRKLKLINPCEKIIEIKLPPDRETFLEKMAVSSPSDFAVAIIYGCRGDLGFWRPGNRDWTRIWKSFDEYPSYYGSYSVVDVTYFDGQFYAVNSIGEIRAFDIKGAKPTKSKVGKFVVSVPHIGDKICITGSGKLLLVVTFCRRRKNTHLFGIFEVNTVTKTWKKKEDLDGKALFTGDHNASILVESTQGIKGDHIYDILTGNLGSQASCYSLTEKKWESLYSWDSNISLIWMPPNF